MRTIIKNYFCKRATNFVLNLQCEVLFETHHLNINVWVPETYKTINKSRLSARWIEMAFQNLVHALEEPEDKEIITLQSPQFFFLNYHCCRPQLLLEIACLNLSVLEPSRRRLPTLTALSRVPLIGSPVTSSCGPVTSSCGQQTQSLFQLLPVTNRHTELTVSHLILKVRCRYEYFIYYES